jgi:hypothetical protein
VAAEKALTGFREVSRRQRWEEKRGASAALDRRQVKMSQKIKFRSLIKVTKSVFEKGF